MDSVEIVWYKTNIQKSVVFLCTNNELSERENKKTICLKSHKKRIKYLEINLTKEVKDRYPENYKMLINEGNWRGYK